MTNPYSPTSTNLLLWRNRDRFTRHAFAGAWLAGAGLIHFLAMNLLADIRSFSSLETSPLILIVFGWLVMYRFRIAIVLARLIGSISIVFLVIALIVLMTGFGDRVEIVYGSVSLKEPTRWQVGLMLLLHAVTFLPPWWYLQKAIAEEQ